MAQRKQIRWHIAVFLAPAVLVYTAIMIVPLFGTLNLSLFNLEQGNRVFVGMRNFATLFGDPRWSDAFWTALGLALGTYLNWKITAKRLRNYSAIAGDAITIPEYFSNRFKENRKVIMLIASVFILVFFTVYAASCFVTVGKLFNSLFGIQYQVVMIAGAFFVILYTLLGGFLAESVSDFMQGIIMFIAIILVLP